MKEIPRRPGVGEYVPRNGETDADYAARIDGAQIPHWDKWSWNHIHRLAHAGLLRIRVHSRYVATVHLPASLLEIEG